VFYYPLRYYLGGVGTLRGYPYFTIAGGKVLFGRANFTFPIFNRGGKELPPYTFDKLYASLFVEAGGVGNFAKLSDLKENKFKADAFLVDFGAELRMQIFSTYRLPMFGYFIIAFPVDKTVPDRNDPSVITTVDDYRIYFGMSI
jgi:outer membrane protein assembly factor BamA